MSHPEPTTEFLPDGNVVHTRHDGRIDVWRWDRRLGWTGPMPGAPPTSAWAAIWRDPKTKHLMTADASSAAEAAAALRAGLQIGA